MAEAQERADEGGVIAGWEPGQGHRQGGIGSLLLGVPDNEGRLTFVGNVGTGFTDAALKSLAADVKPLVTDDPPLVTPISRPRWRDAPRAHPILVGEVTFSEWTGDGRMRHPSWRGLRPDTTATKGRHES